MPPIHVKGPSSDRAFAPGKVLGAQADTLECCGRNYDSAPALRRRFPPDCMAGADLRLKLADAGAWADRARLSVDSLGE
jgi:hypothetical protein